MDIRGWEVPELVEDVVSRFRLYFASGGEPSRSCSLDDCRCSRLTLSRSCLSSSRSFWKADVAISLSYKAFPPIFTPDGSSSSSLTPNFFTDPEAPTGILYIFCRPPNIVLPSPGLDLLMTLPSSVSYPPEPYDIVRIDAKGRRIDPSRPSVSPISERPCPLNRSRRDARFGKRTLSSLAFPIFDDGSSCSRSMLNLADKLGMRRLVRKSSEAGSAVAILISGLGSGASLGFRHLHDGIGKDGGSESNEGLRFP